MIKRRLKSVTAPRKRPKPKTTESRKAAAVAKKRYVKNRTKILKAAQKRRQKLTLAEKVFNKKRTAFLKKSHAPR